MYALRMQPFVPPKQAAPAEKPLSYRMLLVGVQGVGKYSLHHQFIYDCFPSIRDPFFDTETTDMIWKVDEDGRFTFRVDPTRMNISRPGDPAHSEHLYPNTRLPIDMFRLSDANGMILVYSITSSSSFSALQQFIEARIRDSKTGAVEPKILCLVGNKLDCSRDKRSVLCLEGEELAQKLGCPFIECSAKDQKGLSKLKSATVKVMETQRQRLGSTKTGTPQDRGQLARSPSQTGALLRRLSDVGMLRSDTQRSSSSSERNSSRQSTDRRNGNGSLTSPTGQVSTLSQYRSRGAKPTSLSSEDRIDEEDELEEDSRSSSQQSSQNSSTSTTTKSSNITITPPSSNTASITTIRQYRSKVETLPRASSDTRLVEKKTVDLMMEEKKEFDRMMSETRSPHVLKETMRSISHHPDMSRGSGGSAKQKPNGVSITPSAQVLSLGTLFQYHPPPKKEKKQKQDLSPPQPPQPQRPILQPIQSIQPTQPSQPTQPPAQPIQSFESLQPFQPIELSQPEPEHVSYPPSPVLAERRKLEEEKARLEEERNKLQEEMQKLQEQQRRLEERRKIDEERRKVEDERKQVEMERRKIEEEKQKIDEANRKMEEEEASRKLRENKRLQQEQLQQEHQRRLNLRYLMGNDYDPQLRHPQQRHPNNGLIQNNSPQLKQSMDDLVQQWPPPQQQPTNDSKSSPRRVLSKRQSNLNMAPRYVFERQRPKDDLQIEPPPKSQLRSSPPQQPANHRRSNSVTTTPAGNSSSRGNRAQLKNIRQPPSRSVTAPTGGIYSQEEWTDSHPRLPFPGRYI